MTSGNLWSITVQPRYLRFVKTHNMSLITMLILATLSALEVGITMLGRLFLVLAMSGAWACEGPAGTNGEQGVQGVKRKQRRKYLKDNFWRVPRVACQELVAGPSPHSNTGSADIKWVTIPGGSFQMGSKESDDEQPVHTVRVPTFQISRSEITIAQYRACVQAGVCSEPAVGKFLNWGETERDHHPVNGVNWSQASEFCDWIGARLPSEAEWEYAARSGGRDQEYPWGDEAATCRHAVMKSQKNWVRTRPNVADLLQAHGKHHPRTLRHGWKRLGVDPRRLYRVIPWRPQ